MWFGNNGVRFGSNYMLGSKKTTLQKRMYEGVDVEEHLFVITYLTIQ